MIFYRVRIQAVNAIGVGPFSTPVRVTTRPLPPNPSKLECIAPAPNSLKLKWGDQRGLDTNHYTLEMEKEDGKWVKIQKHLNTGIPSTIYTFSGGNVNFLRSFSASKWYTKDPHTSSRSTSYKKPPITTSEFMQVMMLEVDHIQRSIHSVPPKPLPLQYGVSSSTFDSI